MDYWSPNRDAPYIDGLPIIKPPYGRIVAIDLNRGEHVWTAVNGDGPREHPLLKDLNLPPLGTASRPTALVTKTLLFIGDGSNVVRRHRTRRCGARSSAPTTRRPAR